MKVILQEEIENVGHIGDMIDVKQGFARNFLLPRGKAIAATTRSLKQLEHTKRLVADKAKKAKGETEAFARTLVEMPVTITVADEARHGTGGAPEAQIDVGVGQYRRRAPGAFRGTVELVEVIGAGAQGALPIGPTGGRVAVQHVRRGAEEALAAHLAFVGIGGHIGVGLAWLGLARGARFEARGG